MGPEDEFIEQLADRQSRRWFRPIVWGVALLISLIFWASIWWWLA